MKHFPQALYICPGNEQLESGLFTTRLAHDAEERDAALAAGWHVRQEDAKAAYDEAQQAEAAAAAAKLAENAAADQMPTKSTAASADDAAPPNRAELEKQAADLGLTFSPNLGDKKLADRIAAKLAENAAA